MSGYFPAENKITDNKNFQQTNMRNNQNLVAFPRRTLLNLDSNRTVIAVLPHMTEIPVHRDTPTMSTRQMEEWARNNDGIIMQQDDAYFPPFVLAKYENGQVVSVS